MQPLSGGAPRRQDLGGRRQFHFDLSLQRNAARFPSGHFRLVYSSISQLGLSFRALSSLGMLNADLFSLTEQVLSIAGRSQLADICCYNSTFHGQEQSEICQPCISHPSILCAGQSCGENNEKPQEMWLVGPLLYAKTSATSTLTNGGCTKQTPARSATYLSWQGLGELSQTYMSVLRGKEPQEESFWKS